MYNLYIKDIWRLAYKYPMSEHPCFQFSSYTIFSLHSSHVLGNLMKSIQMLGFPLLLFQYYYQLHYIHSFPDPLNILLQEYVFVLQKGVPCLTYNNIDCNILFYLKNLSRQLLS